VALAEVFGQDSVDDLLLPMHYVARRDALALFERTRAAQADLVRAIDQALSVTVDYLALVASDDELREAMLHQVDTALGGPEAHDAYVNAHIDAFAHAEGGPDPVGDAYRELLRAIFEFAEEVVEHRG
jgi:hypothetical protein